MPDNPVRQLPPEQREGVARALAPTIEQLVQVGKYEPPFGVRLTVELTDANGRTWTAAVTASDIHVDAAIPAALPAR